MRQSHLLVLGLLIISSILFTRTAHAADAAKHEMAKLEGQWSMVSGQADGQPMPPQMVQTGRRVAKDGETTITFNGQLYFKAKFTIDPTKTPKQIDYDMIEGPTKGKKQLGIYELDGDTVKFCFAAPGGDRPADFTADAGSHRTSSVWKRDKPAGADKPAASGANKSAVDQNQLEQNKQTAVAFYTLAFNDHRPADAVARYVGRTYRQHNPFAADGAAAFVAFVDRFAKANPGLHVDVKRVIAEGDLVVVHVHVTTSPQDRGTSAIDIFRLEDGKVVEHWDAVQPVPEKSANENTMF